jgi:hypothetical protein
MVMEMKTYTVRFQGSSHKKNDEDLEIWLRIKAYSEYQIMHMLGWDQHNLKIYGTLEN